MTRNFHWFPSYFIVLLWQTCRSFTVEVCRSKHCCKQAPLLLETVVDLIGIEFVKPCSCLSHCETGANAQIIVPGTSPVILHELKDVTSVLAQLEFASVPIHVPKLLGAAAKVMERVHATKGTLTQENTRAFCRTRQHFIESPFRRNMISITVLLVANNDCQGRYRVSFNAVVGTFRSTTFLVPSNSHAPTGTQMFDVI